MIERISKRYISCPICGKTLMKCQGSCSIEITCMSCKQEIVVLSDDERIIVLRNRRGMDRPGSAGCARVSKKAGKPTKVPFITEIPVPN